uniref:Uncharacterized protein n=1 Tax=Clytia hemisphaerica TaxID=252671 RepID=A0A7M5XM18_9CNID
MSKKSSEKSKSTDGGTTAGNETLAVTYEQLKTLVNDVVEKDFGPQIMKSTKDTVKAASVQSAENQLTNLAKLKKKLEKKRANDNIVLKKTGHQDQFAHNTAVLETIEDTLEFMEETDVDGMKEALNKDHDPQNLKEKLATILKIKLKSDSKFFNHWEFNFKFIFFATILCTTHNFFLFYLSCYCRQIPNKVAIIVIYCLFIRGRRNSREAKFPAIEKSWKSRFSCIFAR